MSTTIQAFDEATCISSFSHEGIVCGFVQGKSETRVSPTAWCSDTNISDDDKDNVFDFCKISPCIGSLCSSPAVTFFCEEYYIDPDQRTNNNIAKKVVQTNQFCKMKQDEDCIREYGNPYPNVDFDFKENFESTTVFDGNQSGIEELEDCCQAECLLRFQPDSSIPGCANDKVFFDATKFCDEFCGNRSISELNKCGTDGCGVPQGCLCDNISPQIGNFCYKNGDTFEFVDYLSDPETVCTQFGDGTKDKANIEGCGETGNDECTAQDCTDKNSVLTCIGNLNDENVSVCSTDGEFFATGKEFCESKQDIALLYDNNGSQTTDETKCKEVKCLQETHSDLTFDVCDETSLDFITKEKYCENLSQDENYTFTEILCSGITCTEQNCFEKKARSVIPLDVCNETNNAILTPVEIYTLLLNDPNTDYTTCEDCAADVCTPKDCEITDCTNDQCLVDNDQYYAFGGFCKKNVDTFTHYSSTQEFCNDVQAGDVPFKCLVDPCEDADDCKISDCAENNEVTAGCNTTDFVFTENVLDLCTYKINTTLCDACTTELSCCQNKCDSVNENNDSCDNSFALVGKLDVCKGLCDSNTYLTCEGGDCTQDDCDEKKCVDDGDKGTENCLKIDDGGVKIAFVGTSETYCEFKKENDISQSPEDIQCTDCTDNQSCEIAECNKNHTSKFGCDNDYKNYENEDFCEKLIQNGESFFKDDGAGNLLNEQECFVNGCSTIQDREDNLNKCDSTFTLSTKATICGAGDYAAIQAYIAGLIPCEDEFGNEITCTQDLCNAQQCQESFTRLTFCDQNKANEVYFWKNSKEFCTFLDNDTSSAKLNDLSLTDCGSQCLNEEDCCKFVCNLDAKNICEKTTFNFVEKSSFCERTCGGEDESNFELCGGNECTKDQCDSLKCGADVSLTNTCVKNPDTNYPVDFFADSNAYCTVHKGQADHETFISNNTVTCVNCTDDQSCCEAYCMSNDVTDYKKQCLTDTDGEPLTDSEYCTKRCENADYAEPNLHKCYSGEDANGDPIQVDCPAGCAIKTCIDDLQTYYNEKLTTENASKDCVCVDVEDILGVLMTRNEYCNFLGDNTVPHKIHFCGVDPDDQTKQQICTEQSCKEKVCVFKQSLSDYPFCGSDFIWYTSFDQFCSNRSLNEITENTDTSLTTEVDCKIAFCLENGAEEQHKCRKSDFALIQDDVLCDLEVNETYNPADFIPCRDDENNFIDCTQSHCDYFKCLNDETYTNFCVNKEAGEGNQLFITKDEYCKNINLGENDIIDTYDCGGECADSEACCNAFCNTLTNTDYRQCDVNYDLFSNRAGYCSDQCDTASIFDHTNCDGNCTAECINDSNFNKCTETDCNYLKCKSKIDDNTLFDMCKKYPNDGSSEVLREYISKEDICQEVLTGFDYTTDAVPCFHIPVSDQVQNDCVASGDTDTFVDHCERQNCYEIEKAQNGLTDEFTDNLCYDFNDESKFDTIQQACIDNNDSPENNIQCTPDALARNDTDAFSDTDDTKTYFDGDTATQNCDSDFSCCLSHCAKKNSSETYDTCTDETDMYKTVDSLNKYCVHKCRGLSFCQDIGGNLCSSTDCDQKRCEKYFENYQFCDADFNIVDNSVVCPANNNDVVEVAKVINCDTTEVAPPIACDVNFCKIQKCISLFSETTTNFCINDPTYALIDSLSTKTYFYSSPREFCQIQEVYDYFFNKDDLDFEYQETSTDASQCCNSVCAEYLTYNTIVRINDAGNYALYSETDLCSDLCDTDNFFTQAEADSPEVKVTDVTCSGDCVQRDEDLANCKKDLTDLSNFDIDSKVCHTDTFDPVTVDEYCVAVVDDGQSKIDCKDSSETVVGECDDQASIMISSQEYFLNECCFTRCLISNQHADTEMCFNQNTNVYNFYTYSNDKVDFCKNKCAGVTEVTEQTDVTCCQLNCTGTKLDKYPQDKCHIWGSMNEGVWHELLDEQELCDEACDDSDGLNPILCDTDKECTESLCEQEACIQKLEDKHVCLIADWSFYADTKTYCSSNATNFDATGFSTYVSQLADDDSDAKCCVNQCKIKHASDFSYCTMQTDGYTPLANVDEYCDYVCFSDYSSTKTTLRTTPSSFYTCDNTDGDCDEDYCDIAFCNEQAYTKQCQKTNLTADDQATYCDDLDRDSNYQNYQCSTSDCSDKDCAEMKCKDDYDADSITRTIFCYDDKTKEDTIADFCSNAQANDSSYYNDNILRCYTNFDDTQAEIDCGDHNTCKKQICNNDDTIDLGEYCDTNFDFYSTQKDYCDIHFDGYNIQCTTSAGTDTCDSSSCPIAKCVNDDTYPDGTCNQDWEVKTQLEACEAQENDPDFVNNACRSVACTTDCDCTQDLCLIAECNSELTFTDNVCLNHPIPTTTTVFINSKGNYCDNAPEIDDITCPNDDSAIQYYCDTNNDPKTTEFPSPTILCGAAGDTPCDTELACKSKQCEQQETDHCTTDTFELKTNSEVCTDKLGAGTLNLHTCYIDDDDTKGKRDCTAEDCFILKCKDKTSTVLDELNVCFSVSVENRFFFQGQSDFCQFLLDNNKQDLCDQDNCTLDDANKLQCNGDNICDGVNFCNFERCKHRFDNGVENYLAVCNGLDPLTMNEFCEFVYKEKNNENLLDKCYGEDGDGNRIQEACNTCTQNSCQEYLTNSENYTLNTICTNDESLSLFYSSISEYCTALSPDPNFNLFRDDGNQINCYDTDSLETSCSEEECKKQSCLLKNLFIKPYCKVEQLISTAEEHCDYYKVGTVNTQADCTDGTGAVTECTEQLCCENNVDGDKCIIETFKIENKADICANNYTVHTCVGDCGDDTNCCKDYCNNEYLPDSILETHAICSDDGTVYDGIIAYCDQCDSGPITNSYNDVCMNKLHADSTQKDECTVSCCENTCSDTISPVVLQGETDIIIVQNSCFAKCNHPNKKILHNCKVFDNSVGNTFEEQCQDEYDNLCSNKCSDAADDPTRYCVDNDSTNYYKTNQEMCVRQQCNAEQTQFNVIDSCKPDECKNVDGVTYDTTCIEKKCNERCDLLICNQSCTGDDLQCGEDGIVYDNSCLATCAGVTQESCGAMTKADCETYCTAKKCKADCTNTGDFHCFDDNSVSDQFCTKTCDDLATSLFICQGDCSQATQMKQCQWICDNEIQKLP